MYSCGKFVGVLSKWSEMCELFVNFISYYRYVYLWKICWNILKLEREILHSNKFYIIY